MALARSLRHRARDVTVRTKAALLHQLQRNHRLYRLVLKARVALDPRLRGSNAATRARSPQEMAPALAAYRRGLAWRALDAMRQLYAFYQAAVLTGTTVAVAPATRLEQAAPASSRACHELADAVRQSPDFAEAWLELGFARLAAAEPAAALEAFARAATLPPMLARTHSDPDPRTVAAIEQARLLARKSGAAAALAVLDAAPLVRPVPWALHDLRAGLLLEAGRIDEALEVLELCMRRDHIHPSFAALLPRDLAMLEAVVTHRV
jgi:tetratricopeptide (TPR) repeat protein